MDRNSDETSRILNSRFTVILSRWKKAIKESRFAQRDLPYYFDDPFKIDDPERAKPAAERAATNLVELMLRMFPFVLVMWSLAGALYPAVDLCAGEKERGTMETLLISPASREEIVWGKFLTIWVFSAATALLNLFSMAVTAWTLGSQLPVAAFRPAVLFWSVLLVLPLSAFFSAVSLAVGAYARSSKEGQYYLMPLFLVTLPLVCLTLAPGVRLSPLYSMVPVTGIALLLQQLISPDPASQHPLALLHPRAGADGDLQLAGVALGHRTVSARGSVVPRGGALGRGFVAAPLIPGKGSAAYGRPSVFLFRLAAGPTLVVARFWTRQTRFGLHRRLSISVHGRAAPVHGLAAYHAAAPGTGIAPAAGVGVAGGRPVSRAVRSALGLVDAFDSGPIPWIEAVAPREPSVDRSAAIGRRPNHQLLSGAGGAAGTMRGTCFPRLYPDGPAPALPSLDGGFSDSFLYALFQMNVFQFVPDFVLGVILALIALRTGSVMAPMVFHLVYNLCFIAPSMFPQVFARWNAKASAMSQPDLLVGAIALGCAILAAGLLSAMLLYGKRQTFAESPTLPAGSRLNS